MTMLAAAFGGVCSPLRLFLQALPRGGIIAIKDPGDLPDESRNAERINVANSSRVNGESGRRYAALKEALMAVVATRLAVSLARLCLAIAMNCAAYGKVGPTFDPTHLS